MLAVAGKEQITVPQYEQAFLRTRATPPESDDEKRAFLSRLVDYRLKVQEARRRGLDADPALRADIAAYRNQIAVLWQIDKQLFEPGMRTLYERRGEMLKLQQIEIRWRSFPDGSLDTAGTRQLAESVQQMARVGGVPFDSLVMRYSDSESRQDDLGVLDWLIAGMTMPQLDDIMYALKEGEVAPGLLRTRYGFYILRCVSRIPARQRVRASQILYRLNTNNPTDTAAGVAQLTLILDSLRTGKATFEDLARRNSMDGVSGAKGGDMGWLDRGLYLEPTFERALFSLKRGEVSGIVRTPFGLHVILVTEDPARVDYADVKAELRTAYRTQRFEEDYRNYTQALREKYKYTVSPDVVRMLIAKTGAGMTTSTPGWDAKLTEQERDAFLFRLADAPMRIRDVRERMQSDQNLQMRPFTQEGVDSLCILIANREVLLREAAGLETRDAEFARMLKDFEESSMVSRLEFDETQKHAAISEAEARAWWEQHRREFRMPDRVIITEIHVPADRFAERLLDSLKNGADFTALARRHTRRPGYWDRNGSWGWVSVDLNEMTRQTVGREIGDIFGPVRIDNGSSLVRLDGREAAREKSFDEALNEVRSRMADERMQQTQRAWIESLRESYGVTEHVDRLGAAFPAQTR